jgi:hypothetical protein
VISDQLWPAGRQFNDTDLRVVDVSSIEGRILENENIWMWDEVVLRWTSEKKQMHLCVP